MSHKSSLIVRLLVFGMLATALVGLAVSNGAAAPTVSPLTSSPDFTEDVRLVMGGGKDVLYADLDGDNDQDLIVSGFDGATYIALGDGNGDFSSQPVRIPADPLEVGDLNGDGRFDLLANGGGYLVILYNLGPAADGSWAGFPLIDPLDCGDPGVACLSPTSSLLDATLADLDNDDDLDILVQDGVVKLFRNQGASGWNMEALDFAVWKLAAGDLNNDGRVDLIGVVGQPYNPLFFLYKVYWQQSGSYTAATAVEIPGVYSIFALPKDIALGDLNGDHWLDIIATIQQSFSDHWGGVLQIINDGGTFTPVVLVEGGFYGADIGDVDGDGDLDIALTASPVQTHNGNSMPYPDRVLLNNGAGTFDQALNLDDGYTDSYGVALVDADGDSDLDIVLAHSSQTALYVNQSASGWGMQFLGANTDGALLADLDGDGDLDILQSPGSGEIEYSWRPYTIHWNDGQGNFPTTTSIGNPGSSVLGGPVAGDVDGDGDLDLLIWTTELPRQKLQIYHNQGRGNFSLSAEIDGVPGAHPYLGDLDNDGDLDYITRDGVYFNDGSGAFGARAPLPGSAGGMAVGDLENDGDLDLVGSDGSQIFTYLNDGFGQFSSNLLYAPGAVRDLALADMNGDGRLDILCARSGAPNHLIIRNGDASLTVRSFSNPSSDLNRLITASDLDSDGDLDAVVAVYAQSSVAYYNDGQGKLSRNQVLPLTFLGPQSLSVGDADQDGDPDILIASTSTDAVNGGLYLVRNGRYLDLHAPNYPPASAPRQPDGLPAAAFLSSAQIHAGQVISIPVRINEPDGSPIRGLQAYYSPDGGGTWRPALPASSWFGGLLPTRTSPDQMVDFTRVVTYPWDTFASGFFGSSDHVILRFQAHPGLLPHPLMPVGGETLPFRARGTQVRVVDPGGNPVSEALLLRLPAGQTSGARLIGSAAGEPFRTNVQGYLSGRGELALGDSLFALAEQPLPSGVSPKVHLFYTNMMPNLETAAGFTITTPGVQTVVVSADRPLLTFDLDVSLEWDARNDPAFMEQLTRDLGRTSELIYDWTDGQAALGQIHIYHDRQNWAAADVRLLASNRYRPHAYQGGITPAVLTETVTLSGGITATLLYEPGHLEQGASWNRFGEAAGNLAEDWPRAFAHELAHYLFFLDDNYYGFDADGAFIPVDSCFGALANPYSVANDELAGGPNGWLPGCADTSSQRTSGRSDWETLKNFYPGLAIPAATNTGPLSLPIAVTQVAFVDPAGPAETLAAPYFDLRRTEGGRYTADPRAQAYLLSGDRLAALGSPDGDRLQARGARPGDRLCVFDPAAGRSGCETVSTADLDLALEALPDWAPDLTLRPVTTKTLEITLTLGGPAAGPLNVRLFPNDGSPSTSLALAQVLPTVYRGTLDLPRPVTDAFVLVWAGAAPGNQSAVASYSLGGAPLGLKTVLSAAAPDLPHRPTPSGTGKSKRPAPLTSPDGRAVLVGPDLDFEPGAFFALQMASRIPQPPSWTTPAGQAYRLFTSFDAPSMDGAYLQIFYLRREVAPGEEAFLTVYYCPLNCSSASDWRPLETRTSTTGIAPYAVAPAQGEGLYALMTTIPLDLPQTGWNLFSYPVNAERPVPEALASITSTYTTVYGYESTDLFDPWKVYDVSAPAWVNDLLNLRFGQGYWINLLEPVTVYFKGSWEPAAQAPAVFPTPPATFYGRVILPDVQPGAPVLATIGGKTCGLSVTHLEAGELVYSIDVFADDGGAMAGCGAPGRVVTLSTGGYSFQAAWRNDQLTLLDLARYFHFLPMVKSLP